MLSWEVNHITSEIVLAFTTCHITIIFKHKLSGVHYEEWIMVSLIFTEHGSFNIDF
jgi:hypothetical protein